MKYLNLLALMAIPAFLTGNMQAAGVKLPAPSHSSSISLDEALQNRHSVRTFDPGRPVDAQTLSDLLWAAAGVNRPDGRRTNPTALNKQEIDIYVFSADGVDLYDFRNHSLSRVAEGDYRGLIAGGQAFVCDAPVSLLLVADVSAFGEPSERATMMAMADAGIVCQNINLFCAANGLATVPRATMDAGKLRELLGLPQGSIPALNNPVGYEPAR